MREIKDWFTNNVEKPLLANGIVMKLRLVKVNNTLKKPGPVFNEMARAAFRAGADYFYRTLFNFSLCPRVRHLKD